MFMHVPYEKMSLLEHPVTDAAPVGCQNRALFFLMPDYFVLLDDFITKFACHLELTDVGVFLLAGTCRWFVTLISGWNQFCQQCGHLAFQHQLQILLPLLLLMVVMMFVMVALGVSTVV